MLIALVLREQKSKDANQGLPPLGNASLTTQDDFDCCREWLFFSLALQCLPHKVLFNPGWL